MTKRRLKFLTAISLPLIALWSWRAHVNARRHADMELFFSYVDGPVNDYAMGITRAMPALLKSGSPELKEAAANLRRAVEGTSSLMQSAPKGWIRSRLEFVLPLHEAALNQLAILPMKKSAIKDWLREERAVRDKIIYTLEDVRFESFGLWKISKTRILELNALIYSLKEAQDAAPR